MIHANTCDKGFKKTRLATWMEIQKRTGKKLSVLEDRPKCKYEMVYLWELYTNIKKGCDQIGYTELHHYNEVSGYNLTRYEADVMIQVDILRKRND